MKWALKIAHLSKKWAGFIESPWIRFIFDITQPLFNMKFRNELSKLLTWAKVSSYDFFHFWPHFIANPWKRSILISQPIWNKELRNGLQNDSIEL